MPELDATSATCRFRDLLERTLEAGGLEDAAEGGLLALLVDAALATGECSPRAQRSIG